MQEKLEKDFFRNSNNRVGKNMHNF
jgi:hypothetical protein